MLQFLSPINGLQLGIDDFWQLPIPKDFAQPEYYIGQTVFHRIKANGGEILCPVMVIGIYWSGIDWDYAVEFDPNHPWFQAEDREADWVDEWQLEAM